MFLKIQNIIIIAAVFLLCAYNAKPLVAFNAKLAIDEKFIADIEAERDLESLISAIVNNLMDFNKLNCISIITDNIYLDIFDGQWFHSKIKIPYLVVVVEEYEDLLSPNYDTLESLRQMRRDGCQVYIIMITNGMQVGHLLRFGDRYRVLDTRAKFILLHDFRVLKTNLQYIWKRIVNVIFIRHYIGNLYKMNGESLFELSTVPFPSPIRGVLVPKKLLTWKSNKNNDLSFLFDEKTLDLKSHVVHVVVLPHVPAVVVNSKENEYQKRFTGMEIEIMKTFSSAMNFVPKVYEPNNVNEEQWGYKQLNGTFSGLLGEMVEGKADIALGNLHYTPYHLQLTDLTIPYITECLTFLTPESLTDYSWKTLILPFKLYMWIAVLIVLLLSGFIFFALAKFHYKLNESNVSPIINIAKQKDTAVIKGGTRENQKVKKVVGLYLFEELSNSILYTYGMLLVVSLPKLPSGWSLRLLTGWYWLYCVLVVVAYRASMTAILANPVRRVTIDTINELAENPIACGGWGDQVKIFFVNSLDEKGKKIGDKFETVTSADEGVIRVTKGELAYFEDIYFLKYLSVNQQQNKGLKINQTLSYDKINETKMMLSNSSGNRNLHIMQDCAINMPIAIGLQKNSPLKPRTDKLLRRIIEAGLIQKWLNDVMVPIYATMSSDETNTKALMTLQKLYGGFVALGIGYFLSAMVLLGEHIHWRYFVMRDPNFDIYALDVYYKSKMLH